MNIPLRLLVHPGPVMPERRESLAEEGARAFRFRLSPGLSLHDSLVGTLRAAGATCAAFTLSGGAFASLKYCIAAPNPEGPQVARYSAPISAGPAGVIGAGGALGLDVDGNPLIHCHAVLYDRDGTPLGGHLLPQDAIAGDDPPVVFARVFSRLAIAQRFDAETAMSIFHPRDGAPAHGR